MCTEWCKPISTWGPVTTDVHGGVWPLCPSWKGPVHLGLLWISQGFCSSALGLLFLCNLFSLGNRQAWWVWPVELQQRPGRKSFSGVFLTRVDTAASVSGTGHVACGRSPKSMPPYFESPGPWVYPPSTLPRAQLLWSLSFLPPHSLALSRAVPSPSLGYEACFASSRPRAQTFHSVGLSVRARK